MPSTWGKYCGTEKTNVKARGKRGILKNIWNFETVWNCPGPDWPRPYWLYAIGELTRSDYPSDAISSQL